MMKIDEIRSIFKSKIALNDIEDNGTVEILGACFEASEETIFGTVNQEYIQIELDWYNSQSLNVFDMEKTPSVWVDVANSEGFINSNYGFLIYNELNGSQYDKVLKELSMNRDSRRAIMIYTRPEIHDDYNIDGMNDFICTNTVQYFIKNNELHTIVNMRSNDVIFGYKNDYAWQKHVQSKLATDLGISSGKMIWQVGSLHIYPRHFSLITGA